MNEINLSEHTVLMLISLMGFILYIVMNWVAAHDEYQFKKDLEKTLKEGKINFYD